MSNPNFRVTISDNPDELIGLSERILAKHILDGAASVLSVLNMADLQAKTNFSKLRNLQAAQLNRDKETAYEARDLALGNDPDQTSGTPGTVDYYVKSARDILLGIYKGKEHKLGDHGYQVNTRDGNLRVEIPLNAEKLIALATLIIAKHMSDGASSPIKGLDMADFNTKNNTASVQHKLAEKLNRDKEKANGERDHALGIAQKQNTSTEGTVKFYVTSVRDVLIGLNRGKEYNLGDWGFDVQFSSGGGAPKGTFTATPSVITAGQSSTLMWKISGSVSQEIDNGIGTVSAEATQVVFPAATTTYKLTATAANGKTLTISITVTVN